MEDNAKNFVLPITCPAPEVEKLEKPPHFRLENSGLLMLLDSDDHANQGVFQKEWEQGKVC